MHTLRNVISEILERNCMLLPEVWVCEKLAGSPFSQMKEKRKLSEI